jgi:hypothetical protein
MARVAAALVVCLLVLLPSAAWSQAPQTNAPPGNSGIDEYLETVPGATGNRPSRPASGDGATTADGGQPATLSPAERARLERLGPDGKAVADVVDATSPQSATPRAPKPSSGSAAQRPTAGSGEGRSTLSAVFSAVTGQDSGGGMGVGLPAILFLTLAGAIGLALMRRRTLS